ncbi:hypothetical protein P879_09389 [Paragonimus westermani]|uniref:Uncharacterized protein n=1 Tax=Paragonimus westermani TaxID=34504 RepID=A0A8T0D665_9TREM|nr:hypothetical protein P879_09389 [Paragonimus westermani]
MSTYDCAAFCDTVLLGAASLVKRTVIGIGGASCAGKTLLCKGLQSHFQTCGFPSKLLSMDDYYWVCHSPLTLPFCLLVFLVFFLPV